MSKQFINLVDVKINNDYTYVRASAPTVAEKEPTYTNGETWLALDTGYSYELTDQTAGTWAQIETDIDNKINQIQSGVFKTVINYLGNYFTIFRVLDYFDNYDTGFPDYADRLDVWALTTFESAFSECTFSASAKTITAGDDLFGSFTDTFAAGDTVLVTGTRRNNGFYSVAAVSATALTVSEDLADESAPSYLFFCNVPASFTQLVGRLIWYDIYARTTGAGLKSERVGTYSFTRQDADTALGYPSDITGGLSAYMSIAIEGASYFVN